MNQLANALNAVQNINALLADFDPDDQHAILAACGVAKAPGLAKATHGPSRTPKPAKAAKRGGKRQPGKGRRPAGPRGEKRAALLQALAGHEQNGVHVAYLSGEVYGSDSAENKRACAALLQSCLKAGVVAKVGRGLWRSTGDAQ